MKDEVREQIDTILENFYYSDGNSADYQEATDHILSLNAIAIVDREAEPPRVSDALREVKKVYGEASL